MTYALSIIFALSAVIVGFFLGPQNEAVVQPCGRPVDVKLSDYFRLAEETPDQIINNKDRPDGRKGKEEIVIGPHHVVWTVEPVGYKENISLSIDGQLIDLKKLKSINQADGDQPIELSVVGEWRQIKWYKLYKHELIAMTLGPKSCTGLMCSVAAQLFFDVETKKATAFGTFATDGEVKLFHSNGGENYFTAGRRFDGDALGSERSSVTYTAYEVQPDGSFLPKKDEKGSVYFLKHSYTPDGWDEKKKVPIPSKQQDTLESKWFEKID